MKKIFRKAMTVIGSAALIGMTVGSATALNNLSEFSANSAVVVGANAAPSDNIAAASIVHYLDANADNNQVSISDGDSYKFEKSSTKFNLGDDIVDIRSYLDEEHMPTLLNEGIYIDGNNDEFDYNQKITMSSKTLSMFDDNDYKTDTPTVGFRYESGDSILTYDLEFNNGPIIEDMPTTDLTFMGKDYYVLSANNEELTLLDSASDAIVAEGETTTISAGGKSYTVSIEFIDDNSAKLNVNGEITNDISTVETYKLNDGSYLGMKEILYSAKDTGISKVEFSIGNGKLVLKNDSEIELNEDSIEGLTSYLETEDNETKLSKITIDWSADDEIFVTGDSVATMPGFKAISLSFIGLDYSAEEEIEISYDGDNSAIIKNFPLKDSVEDINILYTDGDSFILLGKDGDEKLVTGTTSLSFNADEDSYFVASYNDGRDAESYLMKATNFRTENEEDEVTFQYRDGNSWNDAKVDRKAGTTFSIGNVEISVDEVNKTSKTVIISSGNIETNFNTIYSEEGLKLNLPYVNETFVDFANGTEMTAAQACSARGESFIGELFLGTINYTSGATTVSTTCEQTSLIIQFEEEDKDGNIGDGEDIFVEIGLTSDSTKEVTISDVTGGDVDFAEIDDSDVYRSFVYSALATEILLDQGGDKDTVKLIYHGDEVTADVYVSSADAVSSSGDAGVMTVMDTAVDTVAGKNLVVVGGSAINAVAAELLGGAFREAAFTEATGVAADEFLIQSFDRSGKTALLVAGYNAADTEKAVTYLLNNDVDTTVDMKYRGTSATEASLVVA